MKVKSLSHVRLFATPWTAAYQAPRSTGFSRQEYWSGVLLPSPAADFLRVFKQMQFSFGFLFQEAFSLFSQHPCEKSRWEEKGIAMTISLSLGCAGTPMNCFLLGLVYSGPRSQFGNGSRGECCPEICGLIALSD